MVENQMEKNMEHDTEVVGRGGIYCRVYSGQEL